MKRTISIALALLFICTFSLPCLCDSTAQSSHAYTIHEIGISITIPDTYYVVKRDTPESDPVFNDVGITYDDFMALLVNNSIFLNAVTPDLSDEIVVTMADNTINNFNTFSDTTLMTLAGNLAEQYRVNYGVAVTSYDVYHHSQAAFIKVLFFDSAQAAHVLQFYTVYDNKAINITLRSYDGEISENLISDFAAIIDSVIFSDETDTTPEIPASSFAHTDNDTGIEFTVPANWEKTETDEEELYWTVTFTPVNDGSVSIFLGASNVWDRLSYSDKITHKQSAVNDALFTISEIADSLGIPVDAISEKTYNGIHYFIAQTDIETESYGITVSFPVNYAIHIQNGWMYKFEFYGDKDNQYYADFESMLNSCVIKNTTATETDQSDDSEWNIVGWALPVIIFIAVIGIVVVVLRRSRSGKAKTNDAADENTTHNEKRCPHCGAVLLEDSDFCPICGEKTDK